MKLKHLFLSFISVTVIGALSACGGGNNQQQQPAQPENKTVQAASNSTAPANDLPKIKVGTDAKYPPFEFRDEQNQILGIEMDVLNAIGKNQGLSMEFHHFIREDWHKTLQNGAFDMWASAFYGNGQYPDDVAITKPFMEAHIVVGLCDEKEGNSSIQNIQQLQGKKLAVSKYYGQSMIDLAAKLTGSPQNVVVTDTFYLAAREMYNKTVDGVLGANYVLAHFAQSAKKQETTRFLRVESEEPRRLVFLVKKDNTTLLEQLNKGIDAAQADGTIKALQDKWLGGLKSVQ